MFENIVKTSDISVLRKIEAKLLVPQCFLNFQSSSL